jgi:tetratricopeptide (TPR) repeat protein
MNLSPRRPIFNRRPENNIYRVFLYSILIISGLWVIYGVDRGEIKKIGLPTPTPTRSALSYTDQGDANFTAGDMDAAIAAYGKALETDPNDAMVWAKLAQIQVYSSSLKTTTEERRAILTDAMNSIDKAKVLAPDDSTVAATRAFVLDWNSSKEISGERSTELLTEAEQEAVRALQLDNANVLALAFYAEILIDQQNITQGKQNILQALEKGQNLMDVHRVYAYLLETEGNYSQAIIEYENAIKIAPNLTFLYLRAGANYRQLAFISTLEAQRKDLYFKSLEYFDRAAKINEQLGVKDPGPYLSIAKTYSQLGEYYVAGRNVQKALSFRPSDPDVYGQLGIVFQHSRNFEGAILALRCAIRGCTAAESCKAAHGEECAPDEIESSSVVPGMALSQNSLVYYYSYVSNLAALSRPKDNHCDEARQVMDEIRAGGFGSDPIVGEILQENENICKLVGAGKTVPTSTTSPENYTATPVPGVQPSETPTPPGY